jgi:hypothetical protein
VRRRIVSKKQFYTRKLLVILALAGALFCFGWMVLSSTWSTEEGRRLSFQGLKADARVNTVNRVSEEEQYITFTWQQPTGSPRTAGQVVPTTREYLLGQEIALIYDPADATLYTLRAQRPIGGSILLVGGLVFLALAIIFQLALRRVKLRPLPRDPCKDFIAEG